MSELDELRAQLLGIRAQADAAVRTVVAMIEREDAEDTDDHSPRTFGGGTKLYPPKGETDG